MPSLLKKDSVSIATSNNLSESGFSQKIQSHLSLSRIKDLQPQDLPANKGLFESIEKNIKQTRNPKYKTLEVLDKIEEVFYITVKSESESGVLVLGTQGKIKDEQKFFNAFQKQMNNEKELGQHKFSLINIMKNKISNIDFVDYCRRSGNFNVVNMSPEADLFTTFLPITNTTPKVTNRLGHTKLEIDVSEIPIQQQLYFNSYLHLKKNKKYFLFIKKGNSIDEEQKNRLIRKDISLYIDPADQMKYSVSFLNDKISQFLNKF